MNPVVEQFKNMDEINTINLQNIDKEDEESMNENE